MTAIGIISSVGLAALGCYIAANYRNFCVCITKAWFALFLSLVAVSMSHAHGLQGIEHAIWYGLCGSILAVWSFTLFNRTLKSVAFASIFLMNAVLNFTAVAHYSLMSVDLLDVLFWAQIVLLYQLCKENPDVELLAVEQKRKELRDKSPAPPLRVVPYERRRNAQNVVA